MHLLSSRSDLHHRFLPISELPRKASRVEGGVSEITREVCLRLRLGRSQRTMLPPFLWRENKMCLSRYVFRHLASHSTFRYLCVDSPVRTTRPIWVDLPGTTSMTNVRRIETASHLVPSMGHLGHRCSILFFGASQSLFCPTCIGTCR